MPQNTNVQAIAPEPPDMVQSFQHATYRDRLNYWVIARLLDDHQSFIVARFRSHSDAEGHMKVWQQRIPDGTFIVQFDPPN